MRTIRTKVYKFNELSKQAKENAVNKLADINVTDEWWENMFEDAKNIGLKITEFSIDGYRWAKGEFMLTAHEVVANIIRDHGETCETYKTAEKFMKEHEPVFSDYMNENSPHYESKESEDKLIELETDFLNSLLEDYSIMLEKECEYLQTDEAIINTIEANEYEFTKEGNIF